MPLLIIDRFPNTLLSSPRIDIKSSDTRFTVVGVYVCKFPALPFLCGTKPEFHTKIMIGFIRTWFKLAWK